MVIAVESPLMKAITADKAGDGKPVPGTGHTRRGGKHGTGGRTNKT